MIFFPSITAFWPFLLIGSTVLLLRFNLTAGILFCASIVLFQIVKYFDHPHIQLLFLGVFTLLACISFSASAIVAAAMFSVISLLYGLFLFGIIGQSLKVITADALFIAGIVGSVFSGYDGGLLARNAAVSNGRSLYSGQVHQAHKELVQKEIKEID